MQQLHKVKNATRFLEDNQCTMTYFRVFVLVCVQHHSTLVSSLCRTTHGDSYIIWDYVKQNFEIDTVKVNLLWTNRKLTRPESNGDREGEKSLFDCKRCGDGERGIRRGPKTSLKKCKTRYLIITQCRPTGKRAKPRRGVGNGACYQKKQEEEAEKGKVGGMGESHRGRDD